MEEKKNPRSLKHSAAAPVGEAEIDFDWEVGAAAAYAFTEWCHFLLLMYISTLDVESECRIVIGIAWLSCKKKNILRREGNFSMETHPLNA